MEETTIAVSDHASYLPGDNISVTIMDRRWWKRLWHFITFRSSPTLTNHYKITEVENNGVMTIE